MANVQKHLIPLTFLVSLHAYSRFGGDYLNLS